MIPLRDDNATRRLPVVTLALIGLNAAVFALELMLPRYGLASGDFFARAGVTPYELTHGVDLPPTDLLPRWATLFSSMFVHGGWLHILSNMLFLWIFGNNVEDAMTRPRFLAFYLICGMVATTTQAMTMPNSTASLIGASGAIAGVLGAYLVLYPRARVLTVIPLFIVFPVVVPPPRVGAPGRVRAAGPAGPRDPALAGCWGGVLRACRRLLGRPDSGAPLRRPSPAPSISSAGRVTTPRADWMG
jgi:membrane associated rhomboid family serine protease